jgi:hypothetical protein
MNVGLSCKCKDLQVVDSVQIDGIGLKEIIFHRKCRGKIDEHGATCVASRHVNDSKYEIWNLDTKEMIFEATNFNKSNFENKRGRVKTKGLIFWSYDFVIDSIGRITISKLRTKSKGSNAELNVEKTKAKNKPVFEKTPYKDKVTSDKTEGTYRYVKGKYIKE